MLIDYMNMYFFPNKINIIHNSSGISVLLSRRFGNQAKKKHPAFQQDALKKLKK